VKPVVHCDINVPSRWQTQNRTSRHINVFTNGRLFIPPVKIIIPKFSLSDWNSVLAMIGEKVFPLGGVRKLFTMDGHLLDDSKDLQDNYFYVATGLENFKSLPYWKSPRVPSEVQQKFGGNDKHIQTKKRVESKGKEPLKNDSVPPKSQDSVYYAKERTTTVPGPLIQSGAEGDVYKAQTPDKETQEALEVKEDPEMKVEVPIDQITAGLMSAISCSKAENITRVSIPMFPDIDPCLSQGVLCALPSPASRGGGLDSASKLPFLLWDQDSGGHLSPEPAEIVKEIDEIGNNNPDLESGVVSELYFTCDGFFGNVVWGGVVFQGLLSPGVFQSSLFQTFGQAEGKCYTERNIWVVWILPKSDCSPSLTVVTWCPPQLQTSTDSRDDEWVLEM
ncbi:hypothetical protein A6R68_04945, partial [Neotoma lepida]